MLYWIKLVGDEIWLKVFINVELGEKQEVDSFFI